MGMMRQLANELAPDIRVNGVAPSGTATGLRTAASLVGENEAKESYSARPQSQARQQYT